MIFPPKQAQSTAVADPQSPEEMFAEIGELTRANRERRDPEIERRILLLRHRAGADLADPGAPPPPLPEADFDSLPEANGPGLPVVRTDQLSPGLLRAGILRHGCLLIRGVIEPDDAAEMAAEVERSFQARDTFLAGNGAGEGGY